MLAVEERNLDPDIEAELLPPELLLKIIRTTLTSALRSPPLVIHGQFSHLTTTCSGCVYRRLAGVSSACRTFAREALCRTIVLASGCGSAERDEQVLKCLETDRKRASVVRILDASLRGAQSGIGWLPAAPPIALPGGGDDSLEGDSGNPVAGLTLRQGRWERWHEQCMTRERLRLFRILSLSPQLTTLDVDVGFFHDVVPKAHLLPASIRCLTLRNCGAKETLAIVSALPNLDDLTLRLALDWRLSGTILFSPSSLPRLRRFELSTTAFGKPCLKSLLTLLGNSHDTLTSLAFRNKGASAETATAFRPVASAILRECAPTLRELEIKDMPRFPARTGNDAGVHNGHDWFPAAAIRAPKLERVHLTGLAMPSVDFFTRVLSLSPLPEDGPPRLHTLVIEDFDSLSLQPLVEALETVPALQGLEELAVAVSREGEIANLDEEAWRAQQGAIEGWCDTVKGPNSQSTQLRASWKMIKVEGSSRW